MTSFSTCRTPAGVSFLMAASRTKKRSEVNIQNPPRNARSRGEISRNSRCFSERPSSCNGICEIFRPAGSRAATSACASATSTMSQELNTRACCSVVLSHGGRLGPRCTNRIAVELTAGRYSKQKERKSMRWAYDDPITGERLQAIAEASVLTPSIAAFHASLRLSGARNLVVFPGTHLAVEADERCCDLLRGRRSIFVYSHLLESFVERVLPRLDHAFVLISHNSDHGVDSRFRAVLDDPRIIHWFA